MLIINRVVQKCAHLVHIRIIGLILIGLAIHGVFPVDGSAETIPNTLTVLSPNGGERWAFGSAHTIEWSFTGASGKLVNIQRLSDIDNPKPIAKNVSIGANGRGSYQWTVQSVMPGEHYKIKVAYASGGVNDTSDNSFTIAQLLNLGLTRMWSVDEYWAPETYEGHQPQGRDYAVDFYASSKNRPDLIRNNDTGIGGRIIYAPHPGRTYIYLLDLTDLALGRTVNHFTPIDPCSESFTVNASLTSFSFLEFKRDNTGCITSKDETKRRYIDVELIIDDEGYRSVYAHLDILDDFLSGTVQNVTTLDRIKEAIEYFNTGKKDKSNVAIDTGQNVVIGQQLGTIGNWGCATPYHLHFQIHTPGTSFYSIQDDTYIHEIPDITLGYAIDLSDPDEVTIEGQPILDQLLVADRNLTGTVAEQVAGRYQFPAMLRRDFTVGDEVFINDSWDPIPGDIHLHTGPDGNCAGPTVAYVPNGTRGTILNDNPYDNPFIGHTQGKCKLANTTNCCKSSDCPEKDTCVLTQTTWHVWWKTQFEGQAQPAWVAAEYLDKPGIGLVAYYKLDGNAIDSSGYGNDGTVYGAFAAPDRFGNPDGAMSFSGYQDYIQIPHSTNLNVNATTGFTAGVWVKPATYQPSATGIFAVLDKTHSGGGGWVMQGCPYNIGYPWTPGLVFSTDSISDIIEAYITTVTGLLDDQWHHIAGVYDGVNKNMKLYIDGVLRDSRPSMGTPDPTADKDLFIGNWAGIYKDRGFKGVIDDVRIYNRALSDIEIQQLSLRGVIQLPKTGQTKCYNTSGTEISCVGTGQDGEIQAGVAWPNPRFTNPDGTTPISGDIVLDRLTGLEWTKDADMPTFGACSGGTKTWQGTLDYVACLNTNNYLGHNDWRLPNINELEILVNVQQTNQVTWLNGQGFSNVQTDDYWSSSSSQYESAMSYAWGVDMGSTPTNPDGFTSPPDKSSSHYGWPVRTGQNGISVIWRTGQTISYAAGDDGALQKGVVWPSPRFTDNGNSTVTDGLTGLTWTKNANAPGPSGCNPGGTKSWQDALDYVACLNINNYLGNSDWRLPNTKELRSLADYSRYWPSLPNAHPFTDVQLDTSIGSQVYSSSSTYLPNTVMAWHVFMTDGRTAAYYKTYLYSVWPVRGGL